MTAPQFTRYPSGRYGDQTFGRLPCACASRAAANGELAEHAAALLPLELRQLDEVRGGVDAHALGRAGLRDVLALHLA